jgi:hypothetical protein
MSAQPRILEPHIDWRARDVSDPSRWTGLCPPEPRRESRRGSGVALASSVCVARLGTKPSAQTCSG